jgi:hypothetical protein
LIVCSGNETKYTSADFSTSVLELEALHMLANNNHTENFEELVVDSMAKARSAIRCDSSEDFILYLDRLIKLSIMKKETSAKDPYFSMYLEDVQIFFNQRMR